MKNQYILLVFIVVSTIVSSCTTNKANGDITSIVNFPTQEEAVKLLTQEDDFTDSWSQFDLDSRLQKSDASKADVLNLISNNVKEWNKTEIELVKSIISQVDLIIAEEGYNLPFPDEIFFIKTTMKEEGGAHGYTRKNSVVLNENQLLEDNKELLTSLVVHELFHILSRNDASFKKNLYSQIGFSVIQPIAYPESIADLKITNPDAPLSDAYITVETTDGQTKCLMILYAKKQYAGGSFFDYANIGFLKLKDDNSIYYKDGVPTIYAADAVSNFFEQIGRNTQYIIHPEEILADNFTYTILNKKGLPNPELIEVIKAYLKQEIK